MGTIIPVKVNQEIRVAASPDEMHQLISDVPRSASHYPDLQNLVALDPVTYRWEMVPFGYAGVSMQPVYVLRYVHHRDALRVTWDTVPEEGHFVTVEGDWQLAPDGSGTHGIITLDMRFDLPVPKMFVSMAQQMIGEQTQNQLIGYTQALTKTLGPHPEQQSA